MEETLDTNETPKPKPPKRHRRWANTFLIISVSILFMSITMAILIRISGNSDRFFLFGYKPYIVTTDSMKEEYQEHAFVIIKREQIEGIADGDVIAYRSYDTNGVLKPIFHRVIGRDESGLITKGDNLPNADTWRVNNDSLVGVRVWHTNSIAKVIEFLLVRSHVYLLATIVAAVIIISLALWAIWPRAKRRKTSE